MSLSTLGQQLAALNSTTGLNPGSVLPSSRRHEDALGRGIGHSVQLGYTPTTQSHKYKPSILHADSRAASDVPMATIRENCVASLHTLESEVDPSFGTFVDSLCHSAAAQRERGLLTTVENEEVDKIIESLLFQIGLHLKFTRGSTDLSPKTLCCLNVIEYLLRQYDIHLRPKTAANSILIMLPNHESPFFLRLIQLINLAEMPTWSFLRPFAGPNTFIPRSTIAKYVAKDISLVKEVVRLAQRSACLPNHSHCLSFTAAVLVEALSLQTQQYGGMTERTCQMLLPFVITACRGKHSKKKRKKSEEDDKFQVDASEFRNWGHVLAACIIESCVLAQPPRLSLMLGILQGVEEEGVPDAIVVNGLTTVWKLMSQPIDDMDEEMASASMLPLAGSDKFIGIPMDKTVFHALASVPQFSKNLGYMHQDEGIPGLVHLIASLFVVGWHRIRKFNANEKGKVPGSKAQAVQMFLAEQIREPKLGSIWKNQSFGLTASLTSFLVLSQKVKKLKQPDNFDATMAKSLLDHLQLVNSISFEQGIAHALQCSAKKDRKDLALYAGVKLTEGKIIESEDAMDVDADVNSGYLLPPRIALGNADAKVRRDSVLRLMKERREGGLEMDDSVSGDGESLMDAFLSRLGVETDGVVALEICEALKEIVKAKGESFDWEEDVINSILQAMFVWSSAISAGDDTRAPIMGLITHILAQTISSSVKENLDERPDWVVRAIQAIGGHVLDQSEAVAGNSAVAIAIAIGDGNRKPSKTSDVDFAFKWLCSAPWIFEECQAADNKNSNKTEYRIRRQFLFVLAKAAIYGIEKFDSKKMAEEAAQLSVTTMKYSLWLLDTLDAEFSSNELELLKDCTNWSAKYIALRRAQLPNMLHSLASVTDQRLVPISFPAISTVSENIKDGKGQSVSIFSVLAEVALSSKASTIATENILRVALQCLGLMEDEGGCYYLLVPALALLDHAEERIRTIALDVVKAVGEKLSLSSSSVWGPLIHVCNAVSSQGALATMGGPSLLPQCLVVASREKSNTNKKVQELLLSLCVKAASACGSLDPSPVNHSFERSWLELGLSDGGINACSKFLIAAEAAGEDAFPLTLRWSIAGKPLLNRIVDNDLSSDAGADQLNLFVGTLVQMLKGIKVTDTSSPYSPNVIITTGPGQQGGRARSYSVSKNDSFEFITPYPSDMVKSLRKIVAAGHSTMINTRIRPSLFLVVLCSKSWEDRIFGQMPERVRRELATLVLQTASKEGSTTSMKALFSLNLKPSDIASLLEEHSQNNSQLTVLTLIADYIGSNSTTLARSSSLVSVISELFLILSKQSMPSINDTEETEYTRHSIISALLEIFSAVERLADVSNRLKLDEHKDYKLWLRLIESLLGDGVDRSTAAPLTSARARATLQSLLKIICSMYPHSATDSLVPAIFAGLSPGNAERRASLATETFRKLVPVYIKNLRMDKNSLSSLLAKFASVISAIEEKETQVILCSGFASSLGHSFERNSQLHFTAISSLYAVLCASRISNQPSEHPSQIGLKVSKLVEFDGLVPQLGSITALSQYIKELLGKISGGEHTDESDLLPTNNLISILAGRDRSTSGRKNDVNVLSTTRLCLSLLVVVSVSLEDARLQRFIKNKAGGNSSLPLRLWQDLLVIHAICTEVTKADLPDDKSKAWNLVGDAAKESLDALQECLPSHIFLASATAVAKEGGTPELRSRAIRLIGDQAQSISPISSEAVLFRDTVSFMLEIMKKDKVEPVLCEALFVTIEAIVRLLYIPAKAHKSRPGTNNAKALVGVLECCSNTIKRNLGESIAVTGNESRQLVCSAALCGATAFRASGAVSLSVLPKFMKQLQLVLSLTDSHLASPAHEDKGQVKIIQLSMLRCLTAAADTLPQFLAPYLNALLSKSVLTSERLRQSNGENDLMVKGAAEHLDDILARHVPVRQLVPATLRQLSSASSSREMEILLAILTKSVEAAGSTHLSSLSESIAKASIISFEFCEKGGHADSDIFSQIDQTIDLLHALVLKISEVQLRPLYSKLQRWRGELDKSDMTNRSLRRYIFWTFSGRLAKELKTIFLPILATVFVDVVGEMNQSVAVFNRPSSEVKSTSRKKKRKIATDENIPYDATSLQSLKALLECVERALRADAQDGGEWVRADESQRYNALVEPLGKLLDSRIDVNRGENSKTNFYDEVINGTDESTGCVVDCIVALASAAGDEQLWKPLNHSVLQACSNEGRSEVRRAGVTCLLSLVKMLGEEYMVLLPECLPVLSELLEDTDEETAALAQECITLSEEMLGESLQDSLR